MKILQPVLRGGLKIAAMGILALFNTEFTLRAQTVTLDFTVTNGISPGTIALPWHEECFTVAKLSSIKSTISIAPTEPLFGQPPYEAALRFRGGSQEIVSAIITNDSHISFDLVSMDVVTLKYGLGATEGFARITSSAGGFYAFTSAPGRTNVTVSFNSTEWENLSFVQVDFFSNGFPLDANLTLDNFVLTSHVAPEPTTLSLGLLALGLSGFRSKRCLLTGSGLED